MTALLIGAGVVCAAGASFSLRQNLTTAFGLPDVLVAQQLPLSLATGMAFGFVLLLNRPAFWSPHRAERLALSLKASIVSLASSSLAIFLTKNSEASRLYLMFLVAALPIVTEAVRVAYSAIASTAGPGRSRRILLVSDSPSPTTSATADRLRAAGATVIGELSHDLNPSALETQIITEEIDDVVFDVTLIKLDQLRSALVLCEQCGVRTHVALQLPQLPHVRPSLATLGGRTVIAFNGTRQDEIELAIKRLVDIALGSLLLLASLPLILFVMALLLLTSGRPLIFRQERVGLNGRRFVMMKFRTMVVDAELTKHHLLQSNELTGPVFKLANDPRVTRIGGFLRRSSIDELPQLINVLMGEMSLVGPRPPVPSEVAKYTPNERRRLSMKPGITGLWQVSGRASLKHFEDWMVLDLKYIDNWSLLTDAEIMCRTVIAVISQKGAM